MGGFSVDPAEVLHLSSRLDTAGQTLYAHRTDLDAGPDAGRSSQEVSGALQGLAAALAGLAQHIGALADAAQASAEAYERADDDSSVRFTP